MRVVLANGASVDLGKVEITPTIGITDYSRRVTDDFGVTTVVPRKFSRRMSMRLAVPNARADEVYNQLVALRAKTATFIADDRYAWLQAEGRIKEFEFAYQTGDQTYYTLSIDGIAETEGVTDTGVDPSASGKPSAFKMVEPVSVTDAVLTSSSVAEGDAPAWSASATYAKGAVVTRAHRVFESLTDGNAGVDPTADAAKWLDTGPTNRWAMFDEALGTSTIASAAVEVVLKTVNAISALALLDTNAASVRVRAPGYDRTVVPNGAGQAIFLDLAVAASANITVTVTPAAVNPGPQYWDDGAQWMDAGVWSDSLAAGDGTVTIGTFLFGALKGLGATETGVTAGITDYSRKDTDEFGDVTIVERSWSKRMAAKTLIRSDAVDVVADRLAGVRARPSLWIARTNTDSLTIYGYPKDWSIEVGLNTSKLSLSVEGLSRAAPARTGGLGGPVDWTDVTDKTGTKPTDNADKTSENTSKDTNAIGGVPTTDVLARIAAAKAGFDRLDAETIPAINTAIGNARDLLDAEAARALGAEEQLSERISNVVADGGGYDDAAIYARVDRVDQARADDRRALGQQIDSVSARAGSGFVIVSRGAAAPLAPGDRDSGVYNAAGTRIVGAGPMYTVAYWDSLNRAVDGRIFDTLSGAAEVQRMVDYLNTIPAGLAVTVHTYNEPSAGRTAALIAAMERCGAGAGFRAIEYRSAYVLIGCAGVGRGGGREIVRGGPADEAGALIVEPLSLVNGVPAIGGIGSVVDASAREVSRAFTAADLAIADRVEAIDAQVLGPGGSKLLARAEDRATVIADSKAGIVAQSVQTLQGQYDGTKLEVSRQAGIIADKLGQNVAYFRTSVAAGSAIADMTAYADGATGVSAFRFKAGQFLFEGDVIVDGSFYPRKFNAASMAREGSSALRMRG